MEQGTADLGEMFEALQDEVNLVKTEIKQTLVDLREFMAKEQTLCPQVAYGRRTEPRALRSRSRRSSRCLPCLMYAGRSR